MLSQAVYNFIAYEVHCQKLVNGLHMSVDTYTTVKAFLKDVGMTVEKL